jgi:hypothetical protein
MQVKSAHNIVRKIMLEHIEFCLIAGIHAQVKDLAPLSDVDHLLRDPGDLAIQGALIQAISVPMICKRTKNNYRVVGGFRTFQLLSRYFSEDDKTKIPVLVFSGGTAEQLQMIAQYSISGVPLVNCLGMRAPRQIGKVVLETNPRIRQSKRGRPSKSIELTEDADIFQAFFPKVTSPSGLAKLMGVKPDVILSVSKE